MNRDPEVPNVAGNSMKEDYRSGPMDTVALGEGRVRDHGDRVMADRDMVDQGKFVHDHEVIRAGPQHSGLDIK